MVENVLRAVGSRRMSRLNIVDHGNAHGVEIGDDWLDSAATVNTHASALGRLRPRFATNTIVHLQNCRAGQNQGVICTMARILGVPVFAGTGLHNPVLGFNHGDYVSCGPTGPWNPDAGRPSTPTHRRPRRRPELSRALPQSSVSGSVRKEKSRPSYGAMARLRVDVVEPDHIGPTALGRASPSTVVRCEAPNRAPRLLSGLRLWAVVHRLPGLQLDVPGPVRPLTVGLRSRCSMPVRQATRRRCRSYPTPRPCSTSAAPAVVGRLGRTGPPPAKTGPEALAGAAEQHEQTEHNELAEIASSEGLMAPCVGPSLSPAPGGQRVGTPGGS